MNHRPCCGVHFHMFAISPSGPKPQICPTRSATSPPTSGNSIARSSDAAAATGKCELSVCPTLVWWLSVLHRAVIAERRLEYFVDGWILGNGSVIERNAKAGAFGHDQVTVF